MKESNVLPRREGFWNSAHEPNLPSPTINAYPWEGQTLFLERLIALEDSITKPYEARAVKANNDYREALDANDKARKWGGGSKHSEVPYHFPVEPRIIAYRGSSGCRVCGNMNGSTEFDVGGWLWPSGFRHYVEEHNMRPSLAFQEFILCEEVR